MPFSTGHTDIDDLLQMLGSGLRSALGSNLVGFYLTGSLTYGDFDRGSSDIDYLVAMERELNDRERERLRLVHEDIWSKHPTWRERTEGTYVTRAMLASPEPSVEGRPYVNGGAFWDPDPPYGNEWLLNLFVLRECGEALIGPEPVALIGEVDVADVRASSNRDLFEERLPTVDDPAMYDDPHQQAYTVLTLCRILHRDQCDEVASKRVAAAWVKGRLGEPWRDLIERAEGWEHGQDLATADEVKGFLRRTAELVGQDDDTIR